MNYVKSSAVGIELRHTRRGGGNKDQSLSLLCWRGMDIHEVIIFLPNPNESIYGYETNV